MKVVVATLLIISTLVKISRGGNKIEIEGKLAHCEYKSKSKMEKINKIQSQINCNSFIIGYICGDKCLRYSRIGYEAKCQCGEDNFHSNEPFYCCTPPDVTCEGQGYYVKCPMGKKLPLNEICYEQQRCPTAYDSKVAVTTNCNQTRNNFCPVSDNYSSKICTNSFDITSIRGIKNVCNAGVACRKSKNGPAYQQCYNE